jgi:hypothetical protein
MLPLKERPFVRCSPFSTLFPDADVRLNSARPHSAASSLPADAGPARGLRIRHDNRHRPGPLSLLPLTKEPNSPRQRLSPIKTRTMSVRRHNATKPFRMRTYTERGEGVLCVTSATRIRQRSKSLGIILLHKQRNNLFGMIFFQTRLFT